MTGPFGCLFGLLFAFFTPATRSICHVASYFPLLCSLETMNKVSTAALISSLVASFNTLNTKVFLSYKAHLPISAKAGER